MFVDAGEAKREIFAKWQKKCDEDEVVTGDEAWPYMTAAWREWERWKKKHAFVDDDPSL